MAVVQSRAITVGGCSTMRGSAMRGSVMTAKDSGARRAMPRGATDKRTQFGYAQPNRRTRCRVEGTSMPSRYRYSMWDGTQEVPALEANDILDNLTDDLMNFGDLQHALRNLLQRGMRNPMGDRMQGL